MGGRFHEIGPDVTGVLVDEEDSVEITHDRVSHAASAVRVNPRADSRSAGFDGPGMGSRLGICDEAMRARDSGYLVNSSECVGVARRFGAFAHGVMVEMETAV